jgi:hypothetical protein
MQVIALLKAAVPALLSCSAAMAQVSATAPKHWRSASSVGLNSSGFAVDHNLREAVRRELLDTNTVRLVATSVGLTEREQGLFQVAPGPVEDEVWLYVLGNEWTEGCARFADRLGGYVLSRMDGHTRTCLLTAVTNRQPVSSVSDRDLRIVLTNYPMLPPSWFRKVESGTTTNKAGRVASRSVTLTVVDGRQSLRTNAYIPKQDELCRWISYTLVDGDVGWGYTLRLWSDGSLDRIDASKFDAKEVDPKFEELIKSVDSEVEAEMKQSGTFGRLGSIHTYWRLKKEKLKARGVDWHSPSELNRGTIYD